MVSASPPPKSETAPDSDPAGEVPDLVWNALSPLERMGAALRIFLAYVGELTRLTQRFFKSAMKPPFGWTDLLVQCEAIGVKSAPIAMLILFFVGLVFAFQFGETLRTMGAVPYLGKVTSLSIVRELGPVFTALVAGTRIGAGIAAELGSMKVSEQIDAIRTLGASPDKKLLVPRVIAATLMLPILSLMADVTGIFGGMLISWAEFGLKPTAFYTSVITTIRLTDFASGFFKPFFFGFGIAIIGCHHGFKCRQGTVGVGRATTRTVVNTAIMVVVVDFALTRIFAFLPRI